LLIIRQRHASHAMLIATFAMDHRTTTADLAKKKTLGTQILMGSVSHVQNQAILHQLENFI